MFSPHQVVIGPVNIPVAPVDPELQCRLNALFALSDDTERIRFALNDVLTLNLSPSQRRNLATVENWLIDPIKYWIVDVRRAMRNNRPKEGTPSVDHIDAANWVHMAASAYVRNNGYATQYAWNAVVAAHLAKLVGG